LTGFKGFDVEDVGRTRLDVEPSGVVGAFITSDTDLVLVVLASAEHWVVGLFGVDAGVVFARDGSGLVDTHAEEYGLVIVLNLDADSAWGSQDPVE
jgi:hypothetical protein